MVEVQGRALQNERYREGTGLTLVVVGDVVDTGMSTWAGGVAEDLPSMQEALALTLSTVTSRCDGQ